MRILVPVGVALLTWLVLYLLLAPLARNRSGRTVAPGPRMRRLAGQAIALVAVGAVLLAGTPMRNRPAPTTTPATAADTRLAQADRLLSAGAVDQALSGYLAILRTDRRNSPAYARLGYVLSLSGQADTALWAEDQALRYDPGYDEARYLRGVILLAMPGRRAEGRAALRDYLRAAPYGSHAADVRRLLAGSS